jgi:hypothetical protein
MQSAGRMRFPPEKHAVLHAFGEDRRFFGLIDQFGSFFSDSSE